MPVAGAAVAAGAALGALIVATASTGALSRQRRPQDGRRVERSDRVVLRSLLAVAGGAIGFVATRWPAVTFGTAMAGWSAPSLVGAGGERRAQLARSEAVAVWAEMLRDLLASNAGLREAIAKTARFAPGPIVTEVRALDVRAQRGALGPALRRFADDVDDAIADAVIVALLLAERRAVSDLGAMLAVTAASARDAIAMQLRVNAARARVVRTAQLIAGVLAAFVALLVLLNRAYLAPFGTLQGQLALSVVLVLFGIAVWGMYVLSRPGVSPRLLTLEGPDR